MIRTCLGIFALILMGGEFAHAQGSQREFELKGVLAEDVKSLKKIYATVLSSDPSLAEIDEMLRYLYKTNRYDSLEARELRRSGRTILQILAAPVEMIESIEVTGANAIDEDEIIEKLEISKGKRLPKNQILQLIPTVEDIYMSKGYLNAKIAVAFKSLSADKIEVQINVTEGQPCIISDIVIDTSNPMLKKKIESIVRSSKNEILQSSTAGNLRQEILEYFVEDRYLNSSIAEPELKYNAEKTSVVIRLSVENPYQYLIYYEGNNSINSVQLSRSLKLNAMERFGLNPSAELADRLRIHYQKSGFANAKVTFDEQILARDYIKKVKLKVDEGPRVRIREIEVAGKISRPSSYYAKFIKSHSSDLISLGYYNLDDLELGYKNLVTELQNQGYLQAKLQSARSEFQQLGQFVSLKVFIDEGPRTSIRSIKFKGVTAFTEAQLLEVINLKPGQPLSLNAFEATLPKVRDFYMSHGYLDMRINEESENFVRYNELNTEAQIEYEILEGPQVEVASILVQGNEQTKEDVILREIDFGVGDKLSSTSISESEFRLQRLGLFSSVAIRTLEANTTLAKRTVIIEVLERNPGLFNIGGSINNELGDQFGVSLLGYSGIAYRNLMGTARAISLRAEANYNLEKRFTEYDLTASYFEPFIFNDRIRGRVNFTKSVRVFKSELERIIGLETHQVATSLEKDLARQVKFTWNLWSLAISRKFAIEGRFAENTGGEEVLSIATMGPQLDWDLRDHPFMPKKGIFYRLTGDYSNPSFGSTQTVHFYKAQSSLNTYLPLGNSKFIWANSFRGGYLQNLSTEPNGQVPEEVMFSLGGRSTIRGFDPQTIPPRNEFLTAYPGLASDAPMFVRTDSHFYMVKTELRFPFWGDFGGVLFYDGGSVKISGVHFEDEYRDAAGVGFRYNTPVGPVSAELAFKLDRRETPVAEPPFRFHFSIGAF